MTYADLLELLTALAEDDDERLTDDVIIRTIDGEWHPAECLEMIDDEILGANRLFFQAYEWGAIPNDNL